ncbi:MAG TPA: PA14 domain-containing protein, partial [Solirubrobacteraceae bacterium]|nr:PA14 domain-containing protein [Solirubrobacteraceae bacterium]
MALPIGAPATAAADDPVPFTERYVPYEPWSERCAGSSAISGREPAGGGTHPVFVYLTASGGIFDGPEASLFVDEMAARGFVAASVAYDTLFGIEPAALDGKSACVFDAASDGSAVSALCARPAADCGKGIVVTGFSQGGYLAVRAHNHDARVRGAYAIGFSDGAMPADHMAIVAPWPAGTRSLPGDRLRIVNGSLSDDMGEGTAARTQLDVLTERRCGAAANRCLAPDGSGWYLVQHSEVADGIADHCYFHGGGGCSYSPPFDPGWLTPSTAPWGMKASLDWLESVLGHTAPPPAGLQATYFDDPALTTPAISRVDPAVDFDWGLGTPGPAITDADTFSARWTGTLTAASSEPHTFALAADDGGRLWLDGELLIDAWNRTSPDPARATVALTAGTAYAIRLEYREDAYGASAQLRWST